MPSPSSSTILEVRLAVFVQVLFDNGFAAVIGVESIIQAVFVSIFAQWCYVGFAVTVGIIAFDAVEYAITVAVGV